MNPDWDLSFQQFCYPHGALSCRAGRMQVKGNRYYTLQYVEKKTLGGMISTGPLAYVESNPVHQRPPERLGSGVVVTYLVLCFSPSPSPFLSPSLFSFSFFPSSPRHRQGSSPLHPGRPGGLVSGLRASERFLRANAVSEVNQPMVLYDWTCPFVHCLCFFFDGGRERTDRPKRLMTANLVCLSPA